MVGNYLVTITSSTCPLNMTGANTRVSYHYLVLERHPGGIASTCLSPSANILAPL